MSDDARLRILVEYIRDEAQAKAALADLDALKTGAKETGHGIEEAGEGIKIFNVHGREMHRLIHELDHALPGTGLLLRAAFHPETLGIAAVVLGIELITKAVEKYKKKLEEAHEAAIKGDFAAGMEAALEATKSATDEQETYIRNLEEIKRGEHGVAAEMNNQLQLIAAIKAARQGQAEAEKTLALAKLKEDQVMGRITESDEIIRKGEIEKKFVAEKAKAETDDFRAQQKERQTIIDETARVEGGLQKSRDEAKQKFDAATNAQAQAKGAPTRDAVNKAQEEADAAKITFDKWMDDNFGHPTKEQAPKTERLRAEAEEKQLAAKLAEKRFSQAQQAAKLDSVALKADLDAKEKAVKDNDSARSKAQDEQAKATRTETDPDVTGAKTAQQRAQEGTIDAQTRTELLQRAKNLQKEFNSSGAGMSQQDALELLSVISQMGDAFAESMDKHPTKTQMKAEIDGLKRLIEKIGK